MAPEGAAWIGPAHPFDLREAYLDFRAELTLDGPPRVAELHLAADSRYRLWINGVHVGRGGERCWPSSVAVDRLDVRGHLRAGVNRIDVQVYSPGYSHFAYVHRGASGLIAWLVADGAVVLRSGPDWRVRRDTSRAALVERVSIYGTGVEDRDLRIAADPPQGEPAAMDHARIVQPACGPVWQRLRPRATPQPIEELRQLGEPVAVLLCPTPPATRDPHEDLRRALATAVAGAWPPVLAAGQSAILVFDLGESLSCAAGATITATGGERLLTSYAERMTQGKILLPDPVTYCRMRPTDRFILRPGRQTLEGFTPRGARYLVYLLEGSGILADPQFTARIQRYPLDERVSPVPVDARLAAVAAMCRRSTLACLQDGFVDGVWRESSLWLGDAVAQDAALRAISDDPRPLLFAIDMAAEGLDADGLLPSVLPGEIPAYAITDYNFAWIELLAGSADHPGVADATAVWHRHFPVLRTILERLSRSVGADGLLRNPPGRRLFLDWSAMGRGEPNLTLNLRYLHALHLAAGIAGSLAGRPAGAETAAQACRDWSETAGRLAGAITALRTADGWREHPDGPPASQLALAFLILTGLLEGEAADLAAGRIVARSLAPDQPGTADTPALASPFMHHYLFQALARLGRADDIRTVIAARWGRWVDAGDPNTRENWSIDFPDGSACHGFSAHPLGWLARLAAGA